jgi:hypothetical protein
MWYVVCLTFSALESAPALYVEGRYVNRAMRNELPEVRLVEILASAICERELASVKNTIVRWRLELRGCVYPKPPMEYKNTPLSPSLFADGR